MKQVKKEKVNRNIRLTEEQVQKEKQLLEYYGLDSPSLFRMLLTEKHREVIEKIPSTN